MVLPQVEKIISITMNIRLFTVDITPLPLLAFFIWYGFLFSSH